MVIFPNFIEETGALRRAGTISPATKQEEVSVRVNPADRTPPRPGNICSGRSGLRPVRPGLIGDAGSAAAGYPDPLLGRNVVLPKIVENRPLWRARLGGIQAESAEQPNVTRKISPENPVLPTAGSRRSRACPQGAVVTSLIGYVGIGGTNPSPLFQSWIVLPQVVQ